MENLLHQAEIAFQNGYYKSSQDLYFQAVRKILKILLFWYKLYQASVEAYNFTGATDCLIYILKFSPLDDFAVNLTVDTFQKLSPEIEKNARQNLKIALQENPLNIGLAMLEAKLLMLDAQNAGNLDYEKELLVHATSLISTKTDFIPALLLKSQIELYLA